MDLFLGNVFLSLLLACAFSAALAGKPLDILRGANVDQDIHEEILRVFSQNATEHTTGSSENFTFVELVSNVVQHYNDTVEHALMTSYKANVDQIASNPYYNTFTKEIDHEAHKLLQIVPSFDPGAGEVSSKCRKAVDIYHEELNKFSLWALKMYDATAKMPSGLLSGNVNQLGDFDQCIGIESGDDTAIRGQYCLAYLQLDIDQSRTDLQHLHKLMHSHYAFRSNMTDPGHRVPRFSTVNWAICAPSACSARDIETSLKHTLAKHTEKTGLKISVKVEKEQCQMRRTEPLPTDTVVVGLFFVGIIALSVIAGLCEHYGMSVSPVVHAFSLKSNILKLVSLERSEGDIATLHGIRALNAFMLVLSHKSMAMFFIPFVNRTTMAEQVGKPWTVIGRAASLYTDPFIMLSGLLTAYSFVGRLNKTGKLDVRSEYLSRLFRIVPTLGALILFCAYIMPFTGSGPQWNLVVTENAEICKKTGWRNLLFIHNYFGFENMCLTHTHHLGIDTQLFFLSPLMVLLLYKKQKVGLAILSFVAAFSTALRFYATYVYRLNNYVFFGTSVRILFDTANLSYILPSHRLTVYILGIFTGYLLRQIPKDYKLSKTTLNVGWFLSILMAIGAFFGPAKMGIIDYEYDPVHGATYNAFSPIGWCVIFMWVTFLAHTGNTNGWLSRAFSWKGFLISTRLSYTIYLTQFPIFFYNVGRTKTAEYINFFLLDMLNIKEFMWILGASAVLTLLFETPFTNLRNHYLKRKPVSLKSKEEIKIKETKAE